MMDERPIDNKGYGQYDATIKSPTPNGMGFEGERFTSEVRDQVHSLKKLGIDNNVSGKIVNQSFND